MSNVCAKTYRLCAHQPASPTPHTAAKPEDAGARCGRLTLEEVVRRDERRTNSPMCGYVPSWSSPFISDESKLLVRFDLADCETVRGSHAVLSVYRRPTTLGAQQA